LCCICCVALRCVVIRCVVLFTSSALLVFRLCWSCTIRQTRSTSLGGRQSLHHRTRQTQPLLANLINLIIFTYFKTVRIPQRDQLDKLNKPHSLTDKISTPRHNWTNTTTLTKKTNLTIHTYFKTIQTRQRDQLDKIDKSSRADAD